jgi:hypothetical protein
MEFMDPLVDGRAVLSTSQAPSNAQIGTWAFVPNAILVPLYHKIRVPFLRVYQEVRAFDNYIAVIARQLDELGSASSGPFAELPSVEWDIHLTTVNEYKADCLNHPRVEARQVVLEASLPRYLWLARALHDDGSGFDLLFDATGLELSNLCLGAVSLGSRIVPLLRELSAAGAALTFPGCEGIIATLTRDALATQQGNAPDDCGPSPAARLRARG